MRSSRLSFVYLFILATSSFIVFASHIEQENTQNSFDSIESELEALYAGNNAVLAELRSSSSLAQLYTLMNSSSGNIFETAGYLQSAKNSLNPQSGAIPAVRLYCRYNNLVISEKKKCRLNEIKLRDDLFKLFQIQVPNTEFDLRSFNIKGWPEGVDRLKCAWSLSEIIKIRLNFRNFEFIPISRVTYAEQHGVDKLDIEFDYDPSLSKDQVFETLKQRYQAESRHMDAIRIDWNQLDRSKVPKKYDSVPINGRVMSLSKYYKCPEIVDNIHFHPLSDFELFSKTLKSGVKNRCAVFRFKHIQVSKGILPNPRYESEKSNASIVKTFQGIPVLSNRVPASVERTDLCSNSRPEIPNEEIEEVQNEAVISEESEIFPTESSSSTRKRAFHQIEPANTVMAPTSLLFQALEEEPRFQRKVIRKKKNPEIRDPARSIQPAIDYSGLLEVNDGSMNHSHSA